jgi:hypothetical protein
VPALKPGRILESYFDVVDMQVAPKLFEQIVGEPKYHQILNKFFALFVHVLMIEDRGANTSTYQIMVNTQCIGLAHGLRFDGSRVRLTQQSAASHTSHNTASVCAHEARSRPIGFSTMTLNG